LSCGLCGLDRQTPVGVHTSSRFPACQRAQWRVIRADFDEAALRALAYRKGLKPLCIGGAMKVAEGVTSLEEVFKVAPVRVD
jgi:hypothetical protein